MGKIEWGSSIYGPHIYQQIFVAESISKSVGNENLLVKGHSVYRQSPTKSGPYINLYIVHKLKKELKKKLAGT